MNRRRARAGYALIDAVLAIAILGLSAIALIILLNQTLHSIRETAKRERSVRAAGTALASIAVRDENWLATREGETRYGDWSLRIQRMTPGLTHAEIRDTLTGHLWVETSFYHPIAADTNAIGH